MIFFGIVLLIIALICFFIGRSQAGRLRAINAADTFDARTLQQLHQKVITSLGAEAFAQSCEVEGVVECDAPLTGPASHSPCVAFSYSKAREYEQETTTTDSQGTQTTQMERRSETLENRTNTTTFWVRDPSGRVQVNPEGAEIDWIDTANRLDPPAPAKSFGGAKVRELGTRHTERALPVGTRVYVLGCAIDAQGQAQIAAGPRDRKQKFIISRRTERELANAAAGTARNLYLAAGISGVAGVALVVAGLVMR